MLRDRTARKYILRRDGGRCFFCGRALLPGAATLDHYLPQSAGGPSEIFNLVLCCKSCNTAKGDALPTDGDEVMLALFRRAAADGMIALGGREIDLAAVSRGFTRVRTGRSGTEFSGGGARVTVQGAALTGLSRYAEAVD